MISLKERFLIFFNAPSGVAASLYHVAIFLEVIFAYVLAIYLELERRMFAADVDAHTEFILREFQFWLEVKILFGFTVEYITHFWCIGCLSMYAGILGRLKWVIQTFNVLDLLSIIVGFVVLVRGYRGVVMVAYLMSGRRGVNILQVIGVRPASYTLVVKCIVTSLGKTLSYLCICLAIIVTAAVVLCYLEKDVEHHDGSVRIKGLRDTFYLSIMTVSTIGYGDKIPATWPGKIIIAFIAIFSIFYMAINSGILSTQFTKYNTEGECERMEKLEERGSDLCKTLWRLSTVYKEQMHHKEQWSTDESTDGSDGLQELKDDFLSEILTEILLRKWKLIIYLKKFNAARRQFTLYEVFTNTNRCEAIVLQKLQEIEDVIKENKDIMDRKEGERKEQHKLSERKLKYLAKMEERLDTVIKDKIGKVESEINLQRRKVANFNSLLRNKIQYYSSDDSSSSSSSSSMSQYAQTN